MRSLKEQERQLEIAEHRWAREKTLLQRANFLKKEKEKIISEGQKKIPTSKKLIWFLFVNCTIIELITIIVTFRSFDLAMCIGVTPDFTPLVTLIGAVISEVIGYAVYSLKSAKENSQGGITYDMAMRNIEPPSDDIYTNNPVG